MSIKLENNNAKKRGPYVKRAHRSVVFVLNETGELVVLHEIIDFDKKPGTMCRSWDLEIGKNLWIEGFEGTITGANAYVKEPYL